MTLALPFTRKADGTESKAVPAAVRLCSEHLRKFTEDSDQNLKYLVRLSRGGRGAASTWRGDINDVVDQAFKASLGVFVDSLDGLAG